MSCNKEKTKERNSIIGVVAIIIATTLVVVGVLLASPLMKPPNHYWNNVVGHKPEIAGKLGAPNGIYEIQVVRVFNDGTVQAPLCEHSIGRLHGVWKYDNSSVNFNSYELPKLFFVTLKDNVIVDVKLKNE